MLRFYDVSFIFRDNRSAQFPITLFISQNSFSPAGRTGEYWAPICLSEPMSQNPLKVGQHVPKDIWESQA